CLSRTIYFIYFLFTLYFFHSLFYLFFFNHPPPTEIYTLSLHDALPILMSFISEIIAPADPMNATGIVLLMSSQLPCNTIPVAFIDRKSTRLNSSHVAISYAVFCLKKKKKNKMK